MKNLRQIYVLSVLSYLNSLIGLVLSACTLTLCSPSAVAERTGVALTDSTEIYFHQSKWNIDPGLGHNGVSLSRMLRRLEECEQPDSMYVMRTLRVTGAASPEGPLEFNKELSERRADAIFGYFDSREVFNDSLAEFSFLGRDWQGLRRAVLNNTATPSRNEILEILAPLSERNELTPEESDHMLTALMALHGGKPYRWLYTRIFPKLRSSRLYVGYEKVSRHIPKLAEGSPRLLAGLTPDLSEMTGTIKLITFPEPEARKPFYMAVKTNMLFDVLAIPDIGVEFYVGKNWSVVGNWRYGWWDNDRRHRYWRMYGGDVALRYWFGSTAHEKPLTGHHVGVYAGIFTYDFEFGGTGHMGGLPGRTLWDRFMTNAGVEYGYSLPIARRLNIDFTIGVGYCGGLVEKYRPVNGIYFWESTERKTWVGPTKAEVSLVWLIGRGNYNRNR